MQRIKCKIAYDGTHFAGYQVQPGRRTVQSELEAALQKMHKGELVRVTASGRTDARVHAKGQVIHFDSPYRLPETGWVKGLNALLPDDIAVLEACEVHSEFHARFDVSSKEYRYYVSRDPIKNPFRKHYMFAYPYSLDLEAVRRAFPYLTGTHDFTSFCSAKTEVEDRVRTIYEISLDEEADTIVFRFKGNGFLYNMVRILLGTLLEIGAGRKKPEDLPEILAKKDRSYAGKTAPAQGLYLWSVEYGQAGKKNIQDN